MDNEPIIERVTDPRELEIARFRLMTARFDCIVKMYDSGSIQRKSIIPFVHPKPLPPQWFKSEVQVTLESLATYTDAQLGRLIKEAFYKLRNHIDDYESQMNR